MESKGRRALRAAAAGANPAETVNPAATSPVAGEPVESPAEELIPPETPADVVIPPEAPAEVVAPVVTAAAPPKVDSPTAAAKTASGEEFTELGREVFAALVQSQTAVARGLEALSAEVAGLAISGIDAAARTATDMLGVTTLSDAIEVNAGFTRSSFDTLVGGSAKLSELGMKMATEASQPILTQLGKSWIKAARLTF
jgi:hypothetical protein